MAILNKLFSSRKKSNRPHFVLFGKNENESWRPFDFTPDRVRVLLFRECDARRRKILFDSCSVQKIPLDKKCTKQKPSISTQISDTKKTDPIYVEVTNGFGYKYTRPTEEVNLLTLCDMIFGTVPLTFQGTSMKVHSLKSPDRLMCTKVFPSPSGVHGSTRVSESLDDSIGSIGEALLCESISSSVGDIGLGVLEKRPSEEDSGFCGEASVRSMSLGSFSNPWLHGEHSTSVDSRESSCSSVGSWLPNHSSGSMSSLQRRWWRHVSTSMELCPLPCSTNNTSMGRRSKLGLAIVLKLSEDGSIERNEQAFFFDHISVVENIINRLRAVVERAYTRKETYWHLLTEGSDELRLSVVDLFSAPRLPRPVWLGLLSSTSSQSNLAHTFLSDLSQLLATLDTKSTNFFISTLVTAVMTHHLGWVPTVLPGTSPPLRKQSDKTTNQMLDSLAKSHPYNALWAQLGDLQGALGHPLRVSRTILTGQREDLLDKLVRVLSYFIRCGAVMQLEEDKHLNIDDKLLNDSSSTLHSSIENNSDSSLVTDCSSSASSIKVGMHRTSSCLSQMNEKQSEQPSLYPSLAEAHSDLNILSDKVSKLCRVPTEAIMFHVQSLIPREHKKIDAEKQMASAVDKADDVVFVLGEDEKLVGLKHNNVNDKIKDTSLYLKNYHSVRFNSDNYDQGEDCLLLNDSSDFGPDNSIEDLVDFSSPTFDCGDEERPQFLEIVLPVLNTKNQNQITNSFAASLLGCTSEHYIADMVVQACTQDPSVWKHKLRRDLALAAHQPLFDKEVAEAVCVLANTSNWEVQVVSSHTYVVDQPGNLGVRQGMSQLVANMLESVHHLWKLHTPPEHCLQHLESKLREICLHSHALAQLLLATDCCEMEQLTSSLNLEANDVPLLLAVASTHTPQVTQRYGLSFR